jgi:hypothetical protein
MVLVALKLPDTTITIKARGNPYNLQGQTYCHPANGDPDMVKCNDGLSNPTMPAIVNGGIQEPGPPFVLQDDTKAPHFGPKLACCSCV